MVLSLDGINGLAHKIKGTSAINPALPRTAHARPPALGLRSKQTPPIAFDLKPKRAGRRGRRAAARFLNTFVRVKGSDVPHHQVKIADQKPVLRKALRNLLAVTTLLPRLGLRPKPQNTPDTSYPAHQTNPPAIHHRRRADTPGDPLP